MSSAKCWPYRLGLNVLIKGWYEDPVSKPFQTAKIEFLIVPSVPANLRQSIFHTQIVVELIIPYTPLSKMKDYVY